MSEFNVSLTKCRCCEGSVLSVKEELLRKSEDLRTPSRGRIPICDLSPEDVVHLYWFTQNRLRELGVSIPDDE